MHGKTMTNARRYFATPVKTVEPHQVFVFGSNLNGFHGAGAAGFAMRGVYENTWRTDKAFLRAMKAPEGSEDRRGKYAVYGIGEGPMNGLEGKSYAIPTVTRAGAKRSRTLDQILASLKRMANVARKRPQFDFLCNVVGGGLNGYSKEEIQGLYQRWVEEDCPPENVLFPKGY